MSRLLGILPDCLKEKATAGNTVFQYGFLGFDDGSGMKKVLVFVFRRIGNANPCRWQEVDLEEEREVLTEELLRVLERRTNAIPEEGTWRKPVSVAEMQEVLGWYPDPV